LFRGMRRAVIEHQTDDLQACAQCTLKKLQQEGFEIGKLSPAVSGDLKLLSNEQVENVGSPLSVFFQEMPFL